MFWPWVSRRPEGVERAAGAAAVLAMLEARRRGIRRVGCDDVGEGEAVGGGWKGAWLGCAMGAGVEVAWWMEILRVVAKGVGVADGRLESHGVVRVTDGLDSSGEFRRLLGGGDGVLCVGI